MAQQESFAASGCSNKPLVVSALRVRSREVPWTGGRLSWTASQTTNGPTGQRRWLLIWLACLLVRQMGGDVMRCAAMRRRAMAKKEDVVARSTRACTLQQSHSSTTEGSLGYVQRAQRVQRAQEPLDCSCLARPAILYYCQVGYSTTPGTHVSRRRQQSTSYVFHTVISLVMTLARDSRRAGLSLFLSSACTSRAERNRWLPSSARSISSCHTLTLGWWSHDCAPDQSRFSSRS